MNHHFKGRERRVASFFGIWDERHQSLPSSGQRVLGSSSTGAGMLQSRAGCCSWMFPALCSWMVLKCPLGPGAARAWQQLCPAFLCLRTGRQRGAVLLLLFFLLLLLRCPIPVLRSLGLCSALGRDEGGTVFDLSAHSGRKYLLLLSAVLQNVTLPPSIHPWIPSHDPMKSSAAG